MHHWTKKELALLGTDTDQRISAKLKCSLSTVRSKRISLGIPAHGQAKNKIEWTKRMVALLGTDTDERIANKLKVSWCSVIKKRSELGIPAFGTR